MILVRILFLPCLDNDLRLYAYRFEGYWKDVGTIQSYWEANMDLLDEDWGHALNNRNWRIYTNDSNFPPQFIGKDAVVKHSLINSGCFVYGTIESSVLFENVTVGHGCVINQSILHPGVKIGKNATLERVIVMENTEIPEGTSIRIGEHEEPLVINQEILTGMLTLSGEEI